MKPLPSPSWSAVSRRTSVVLAVFAMLAGSGAPRAGAATEPPVPPVPPMAAQLAAAQDAKDPGSVVELCRRQLAQPGANAVELLTAMFRAQVELGDCDRAAQTLDRLEKAGLAAAIVADFRGDLALAADHSGEAVTAWRQALAAQPADPAAILGKIADAYDEDEHWPRAVEALRAYLRVHPVHAARQARLAVCLLNTGQPEAADREIQAANRIDAADETVKAVSPLFDRLRPQLAALRALDARMAAAKPPAGGSAPFDVRAGAKTWESARLDRALIFYRAGACDAALADADTVAESVEDRAVAAQLLRGQCLWQLEHGDEAFPVAKIADAKWFDDRARVDRLRALDTPATGGAGAGAASSEPTGISARQHAGRAAILLEADQPVLALFDAEAAARLSAKGSPDAVEAQVVLAAALLRNGRSAEALAAARRATELAPRNADAWALRGRLEQEESVDLPAAVDSLTRALTLHNEPRWLARRETCLRTLGRLAEADRDASHLPPAPPEPAKPAAN